MITPDDIINRAKRKYHDVLRAWFLGEEIFPIEFSIGTLSKNLEQRRKDIDLLRQYSKEQRGAGYEIVWNIVNTQAFSKQTVPQRVVIGTLEDYLSLIRKTTEFNQFVVDVKKIHQKFPELESWIQSYPQYVIDYHNKWDDLLLVCDYFIKKPRPNVYIRELPIAIHTKFIETHIAILRDLLDQLLPLDTIRSDVTDFNRRFGLKDKPTLIRLRLLDEQLDWLYRIQVDDLSLPISQLNELLSSHIKPKHIIIVENLINFLTLPKLPNTVGLLGGGFAVHILRDIAYLYHTHIIYWGDMDVHGFEILSDLRGIFTHTQSIMMDNSTFEKYAQYAVIGKPSRTARFDNLTPLEAKLCQKILENNLRLEQEHISQDDAVICLKKLIFKVS
ncbi:MAG: DUF2220 family protein [bacterium]|nr:DUF2220 family protein [bacterium]